MTLIRKFLVLGWNSQWLLIEAWLHLGAARAALRVVPFRRLAPHLGDQLLPIEPAQESGVAPPHVERTAWAITIMARHTPWESACLAQAIAAKFMLARRGIPSVLYLGTRKDNSGELTAHAWLRVANTIVLGAERYETFTALAAFGESPS